MHCLESLVQAVTNPSSDRNTLVAHGDVKGLQVFEGPNRSKARVRYSGTFCSMESAQAL